MCKHTKAHHTKGNIMFNKLEGDTAVLCQSGVFKMVDLYEWSGKLFAQLGAGFIRLRLNGTTTKAGVSFVHLELTSKLYSDRFGRLITKEMPDCTLVTEATIKQLTVD